AFILIRFRERPDAAEPTRTRGNLALEIGWTLGPAVIVVLISVPSIQAVFETQRAAPEEALRVEVVGHQWWWEFRYPEQDVVTANELYLPVGRPVEL
ncbi:MAG: cytochrome c oxidase subunit II, partial [Gammaproteobacteria bacterium]|nr:cytochrome c oxidase subunit II [Gemmatimonadota bacterium]NIU78265.1 cytochrome c oxidase subunit II [Gammaproteobacteria bacterium]NIW38286.1 cytochrome c oxidase subunit II [Gemmatimonadota bacterium]NIX23906.1 cytochrome c oxidase subunit II [Actinomycetota bacterium]